MTTSSMPRSSISPSGSGPPSVRSTVDPGADADPADSPRGPGRGHGSGGPTGRRVARDPGAPHAAGDRPEHRADCSAWSGRATSSPPWRWWPSPPRWPRWPAAARPGCVAVAVAVLAGQLSTGWSNDWFDAGRDTAVGRTDKPIVAGTGRRGHGPHRRAGGRRGLRAPVAPVRVACGRGPPGRRRLRLGLQRRPEGDGAQPAALRGVVRPAAGLRHPRTAGPPVAPTGADGGHRTARRRRPLRQHAGRPGRRRPVGHRRAAPADERPRRPPGRRRAAGRLRPHHLGARRRLDAAGPHRGALATLGAGGRHGGRHHPARRPRAAWSWTLVTVLGCVVLFAVARPALVGG